MITVPSLNVSLVVNVRVNGWEMSALTVLGLTDSVPTDSASASPGNAARAKDTATTRPRPCSGDPMAMVPASATGKPTHTTAAAIRQGTVDIAATLKIEKIKVQTEKHGESRQVAQYEVYIKAEY